MPSARSMGSCISGARPPTDPQPGRGARGGEQLTLLASDETDAKEPLRRIHDLYGALESAVDDHEGGAVAFAAKMERPVPDVSRRLRRADDSKGEPQRAPLDYLAHLEAPARQAFLEQLCALWGFEPPVPVRKLDAEAKARLMRSALTDKVLRQLEREHGLPAGSLEP